MKIPELLKEILVLKHFVSPYHWDLCQSFSYKHPGLDTEILRNGGRESRVFSPYVLQTTHETETWGGGYVGIPSTSNVNWSACQIFFYENYFLVRKKLISNRRDIARVS